ncbi:uncharacterized protein [Miscanthus floridulus]|uniref:uncharacterized protein n=1 Tax=Miscanthus floridulus TaxID=154761 RepID=UPI00345ABF33
MANLRILRIIMARKKTKKENPRVRTASGTKGNLPPNQLQAISTPPSPVQTQAEEQGGSTLHPAFPYRRPSRAAGDRDPARPDRPKVVRVEQRPPWLRSSARSRPRREELSRRGDRNNLVFSSSQSQLKRLTWRPSSCDICRVVGLPRAPAIPLSAGRWDRPCDPALRRQVVPNTLIGASLWHTIRGSSNRPRETSPSPSRHHRRHSRLLLAPPTRRFLELLRRPDAVGRRRLHDLSIAWKSRRIRTRRSGYGTVKDLTLELVSRGHGKGPTLPSSTALSLPVGTRTASDSGIGKAVKLLGKAV